MKKSAIVALARSMIAASFPSLDRMELHVEMIETDEFVMSVGLQDKDMFLDVSQEDAARMGRSVMTGVLAHELCHAEEDRRLGPLIDSVLSWLYRSVPSLQTRMERRIDAAVIRKGYGKDLLAFQRYHDRYYEPYDRSDGLTLDEIQQALRQQ